jgi:hypothetical protein
MGKFRKSSYTDKEFFDGKHRFEHWYRDNSVYFITSKVREGFRAFKTEVAKQTFWDRFNFYTHCHGLEVWATSLLDNHFHTIGYLADGEQLGEKMRKLHGSIAWLVMKQIELRHVPFWRTAGNKDYFDGCIRDVLQLARTHRYVKQQAVRARIVRDWRDYAHTRVDVDVEEAIDRALMRRAFLEDVPYERYERKRKRAHRR